MVHKSLIGWLPKIIEEMKSQPNTLALLFILAFSSVAQVALALQFNERLERVESMIPTVVENTKKLDRMIRVYIETNILNVVTRRCLTESQDERRYLLHSLNELQLEYQEVTKTTFDVPQCKDI